MNLLDLSNVQLLFKFAAIGFGFVMGGGIAFCMVLFFQLVIRHLLTVEEDK